MICVSAPKGPVTRAAITQTPVDINFSLFFLSRVTLIDTFMPIYGSKFRISITLEFCYLFEISKILKKSALKAPGNGQSVTYSKIQPRVSRIPYSTPVDWFLTKSVNAKYPLSCRKCVKKTELLCSMPHRMPQVCRTPPKMVPPYSLGICLPKTPKPVKAFSLLHREKKSIFWRHRFFDKLLEWPWSHQKLTYFKIGHKMS